eukprot:6277350-Amphidinium_carterae.1
MSMESPKRSWYEAYQQKALREELRQRAAPSTPPKTATHPLKRAMRVKGPKTSTIPQFLITGRSK